MIRRFIAGPPIVIARSLAAGGARRLLRRVRLFNPTERANAATILTIERQFASRPRPGSPS